MSIVNGYCTLEAMRDEIGSYGVSDTSDDAKIERSVEAASRQIDGHCGWRFWQDGSVQAREFYAEDYCHLNLLDPLEDGDPGDGISTTTGLIVKVDLDGDGTFETTLTSGTDFLLHPRNAATRTPIWPYTSLGILSDSGSYFPSGLGGRPGVQITAKYGWPAVPDDVEKACIIQAEMLFKSKDAPLGVAGFDQMGSAMRVRSKLHPMAEALLGPYRKPAIG